MLRLAFGWWNTSLSPTSHKDCATAQEIEVADIVSSVLLNDYSIDCLALGEVSKNDLFRLTQLINGSSYSIIDATTKDGKISFDLGIIFNQEKMREVGEGGFSII